jgi:hypothetical protein
MMPGPVRVARLSALFLLHAALAPLLHAQFGMTEDLSQYDRKASLSRDLGATHMSVTEGLPLATWEMDANDPYPMWFVHHAGMLTIFPPATLAPYVDAKYSANVSHVVEQRCAILSKYGLKGVWSANEPEILPEPFFTAHPELRGPRIDQPNRSRKVYFAPNVDSPEILSAYRESMQMLVKSCPQVEQFNWLTTDAGSGFDWTSSLYPGINGNTNYQDRPLSDRVAGFLINAQKAAHDAGHDIQINLNPIAARQWMLPTFPPDVLENIVRKLPRGLAVEGREGPDGRRFAQVGGRGGGEPFYPVIGIVVPSLTATEGDPAPRTALNLGDAATIDFNYRMMKFIHGMPMRTLTERLNALRAFAANEVGEAQADNLVEAWSALNDVQHDLAVLDFGPVIMQGHVMNRWITRPMVPFPNDLTPGEKQDYRAFLFQAKDESQAEDLVDIQAMRMYEGWGAKMLFQRAIELAVPRANHAVSLIQGIAVSAKDDTARRHWSLMATRLQAAIYLMQSADNMVSYQAQLDRVKSLAAKPEINPVLGVQSSWDRTELMATARKEIDTMVNLDRLLADSKDPILDLASTPGEETVMRLGPNLAVEVKHKIDTMNAHWRDYDRLFTVPNP